MALWCWMNLLKEEEYGKCDLVRIDGHFDCRNVNSDALECFYSNFNNLKNLEFFLECNHPHDTLVKLIIWDNFVYFAYKRKVFKKIYFLVKQDAYVMGELEKDPSVHTIKSVQNVFRQLKGANPIVLDIDLDYFINTKGCEKEVLASEARTFFEVLYENRRNIKLMTIALSPECCGGWGNSEKILDIFSEIFNVKIDL